MNNWTENNLVPMILSVAGGMADFLLSDDHSWTNLAVSLFLAGFIGYLMLLLCLENEVSMGMIGVYCGVSGASSRIIFSMLQKVTQAKAERIIEKEGRK